MLALWAYPECLVPLSYRLHSELAAEHGGAERWGYRRLRCGSLGAIVKPSDLAASSVPQQQSISTDGAASTLPIQSAIPDDQEKAWEKLPKQDAAATSLLSKDSPLPSDLDWIKGDLIQHYQEMGIPDFTETAQVHPFYFTNAIADLAKEKGVDIRLGAKVTKINHGKDGVRNIEYEDRRTPESKIIDDITDVIVTAGPWTGKLLPRTRIEGLRAHSVVFDAHVSPYAVFTDIQLPADYVPDHRAKKGQKRKHRGNVDPEIYARPNGEAYACGKFCASMATSVHAILIRPMTNMRLQENPTLRFPSQTRPT